VLRRPLILAALITTVIATSMLAGSAHAQTPTRLADLPSTDAYRACIIQTQENPEAGFEAAIAWRDEGGGPPALHCVALALFGLGQMEEAADRLEELATEIPDASNAERASILGQAGSVWLRLRKLGRAHELLSKSIELDGGDPELWIDRGEVLARGGKYWEAIDDFSSALDRAPGHLDALIFRAAAYRLLDINDLARDDIDRVLDVAPEQPDALVELGALYRKSGALDDARAVWLQVIDNVPGSPAAKAAQSGIEQMDVKR
jgi:tetratricopeptide (TPR) repeat protein